MDRLCSKCRFMFDNDGVERDDYKLDPLYRRKWYTHHDNINDVVLASEQGCRMCQLLCKSLPIWKEEPYAGGTITYSYNSHKIYYGTEYCTYTFKLLSTGRYKEKEFCFLSCEKGLESKAPDIGLNTGSFASLEQAKAWLFSCFTEHASCQPRQDMFRMSLKLPSRFIYIDPRDEVPVRLCNAEHLASDVRYMTLSHSWGREKFTTLRGGNLHNFMDEIPINQLKQTFQDAIQVTRFMDVQYLWIDSLCIIQDSVDDWQNESVIMSSVYSNSYCTIAATHASSSKGGLFNDRNIETFIPLCVEISKSSGNQDRPLYEYWDPQIWQEGVEESGLLKRGWCIQERLLSPRILYFSSQQIFFECNKICVGELKPENMDLLPRAAWQDSKLSFRQAFQSTLEDCQSLGGARALALWKYLVRIYTDCSLTMETDRVVAISALTYAVQPLIQGNYVAGLWEQNLKSQLLWNIRDGAATKQYVAPSWSWASKIGRINWPDGDLSTFWDKSLLDSQGYSLLDVHDVVVTTRDDNPLSQVLSGTLWLKVVLISRSDLQLHVDGFPNFTLRRGRDIAWDIALSELGFSFRMKSDVNTPDLESGLCLGSSTDISREFVCMPCERDSAVTMGPLGDFHFTRGLLLRRSGSTKGQYERIGHFHFRRVVSFTSGSSTPEDLASNDLVSERLKREGSDLFVHQSLLDMDINDLREDMYESYDSESNRCIISII